MKKIHGMLATAAVVGTIIMAGSADAGSGCRKVSPECEAAYKAEIAYWKRQAQGRERQAKPRRRNTTVVRHLPNAPAAPRRARKCVSASVQETGFVSGFAYNNGAVIYQQHKMMKAGQTYTWCLPEGVWATADAFWLCKKTSSRYPNGRGKILRAHHMNQWRAQGYLTGVMDIQD